LFKPFKHVNLFTVHRDIGLENILSSGADENEVVKLIDFEFSKGFVDDKVLPRRWNCPCLPPKRLLTVPQAGLILRLTWKYGTRGAHC
jgi:serine/threonine protein kinase